MNERTKIRLLVIGLSIVLATACAKGQTFKMFIKITESDSIRHNATKYVVNILDYTQDTTYNYVVSSNYTLFFEYDHIYKISVSSYNTNSYEYYLINNGPKKNYLMNLIIPLNNVIFETVNKFIYYSKANDRYFIDKI
jgi:hypothetical protein